MLKISRSRRSFERETMESLFSVKLITGNLMTLLANDKVKLFPFLFCLATAKLFIRKRGLYLFSKNNSCSLYFFRLV